MKHLLNLYTIIAIAGLSIAFANEQTRGDATQHFEKAGLAFDFPVEWKVTDNSTDDVHYITVAPKDGAVQISIIAQLGSEQQCDFQAAGKSITDALVERVATQIHAASPQTSPLRTRVGVLEVDGLQLRGLMNNRPVISEIYSLRLNLRFINLVYLRVDNDARGQSGWESMRKTLKLSAPVLKAGGGASIDGNNVLNGRALHLPHPLYPPHAKQAGASGSVVVRVIIDESGKVVSAYALSGHPLLRGLSVTAAKDSEFSPTKLCGEPVRVTGVITYHFVAR